MIKWDVLCRDKRDDNDTKVIIITYNKAIMCVIITNGKKLGNGETCIIQQKIQPHIIVHNPSIWRIY